MILIDNALERHERIFFILFQGFKDNILKWNNDRILIPITGILEDPYIDNKQLMYNRKFSNTIIENIDNIKKRLNEVSGNMFKNIEFGDHYELIKTNYDINFDINHNQYFVYLPQTNELFYSNNQIINKDVFNTHAYVMIMPFEFVHQVGLEPTITEL